MRATPPASTVVALSWSLSLLFWSTRAPATTEGNDLFQTAIHPLLTERCHKCHSHSAAKIKGGLVLDSLAGLLRGGDSGPALVPGDPGGSLLIAAVQYTDTNLQMPPSKEGGGKLSETEIAALIRWIQLGAPWPGSDTNHVVLKGKITDADRQWWSFRPLGRAQPPRLAEDRWSRNPIDRFIWRQLHAEGLQPAPEASRPALLRRACFDLIGVPPTPAELESFLQDAAPDSYEKLIDRLLADPRYGERWARHWLDLVRYADSDGYRVDDYRPQAWRYRDYVISALNQDKPYDRFVKEQLAGDELWPQEPETMVATSFLRHWIYEYNNRDVRGQWTTILNDLTDTAGDLFLGLGVQCARCHDHKFDPILQKDYYRLQAFFAPMLPRDDLPLATPPHLSEYQARLARWEEHTVELHRELEELERPYLQMAARTANDKFPEETQALLAKPASQRTPLEQQWADLAYRQIIYEQTYRAFNKMKPEDRERREELRRKLAESDPIKPEAPPMAFTVTDIGPLAPPTFIPNARQHEDVAPGYLTVLDERPADIRPVASAPHSTGRRAELARWLTLPENALTLRVIVNRIWQFHFGRGLVGTTSDFGRLGEQPSHPELLDWLAQRLVDEGWSMKKMHRLIMTSAAYRQSAVHRSPEPAMKKDPENRWLWHMTTRRLSAEQIRDALLAATGELDPRMGGPSVDPSLSRRTVYTKVLRNTRDPLLDAFDAPEGFVSTAQRNVTTTASQALLMFNGKILLQRATALAGRLSRWQVAGRETQLVEQAYRLVFGREPAPEERDSAQAFLRRQVARVDPSEPALRTVPFDFDKMPYREGPAALLQPARLQNRFEVPNAASLPAGDFTLEAFVLLKSLPEEGSVRTIASHWDGHQEHPGWAFGVTGRKALGKPQSLVLQWVGDPSQPQGGYEIIGSGLHIELHKPYFVAVAVRLAETSEQGVVFYAKDLSNDDEPMQVARAAHSVTASVRAPSAEFAIGGRAGDAHHLWDGLIDDLRLSNRALAPEQLLLTSESVTESTMGFWRFDSTSKFNKDSSAQGNDIKPKEIPAAPRPDPNATALIDFCHVLLNANEFIYVD